MKIILIFSLILAGCGDKKVEIVGDGLTFDEIIWINESNHAIKMTAQGKNDLNVVLLHGEPYLFSGDYETILSHIEDSMPLDWYDFSRMDIYFDDDIHVPYTRVISDNFIYYLEPPADYSPSMSVTSSERYAITFRKEEAYDVRTWTYTFTDADYEAAKEWSEKQSVE